MSPVNLRFVIGKKWIYLERNTLHIVWAILEGKRLQNMAWLVFMGWVISSANEWENFSNYFGKEVGISGNWATAHFLTFYGCPHCHGVGGCVI